jgi:hypothetical protein
MALVVGKTPPPPGHRVRTTLAPPKSPVPHGMPQSELVGGRPWPLAAGPALAALESLARHPRVSDRFTCHLGVKTGANALFLDPPATVEPELVRWALRGRDLAPFKTVRARRLLWPCDELGRPLAELPPGARAHLSPHLERLRARADDVGGPPWALFRTTAAAAHCRVVWADLARCLTAVALADPSAREQIPLNTCYLIATADEPTALRLAAWLNSIWMRAVARLAAPPAASGFARFGAQVVGGLPLPDAVLTDQTLDQIAAAGASGLPIQQQLDVLTARHLGLAPPAAEALASVERRAGARR